MISLKRPLSPYAIALSIFSGENFFLNSFWIFERKARAYCCGSSYAARHRNVISFSKDFKQHIAYPFHKTIRMFKSEGFSVVKSRGANFLLLDHLLPYLYKSKLILRIDAFFARIFPLKFFSQFFILVLTRNND